MTWHRRLPETLYLKDGRKVATLAEARDVLLSLPACRKTDPFWLNAAQWLMQNAYRSRRTPVSDIGSQLSRAFVAGELI
jgi:hypothetical protein